MFARVDRVEASPAQPLRCCWASELYLQFSVSVVCVDRVGASPAPTVQNQPGFVVGRKLLFSP